MGDPADGSIGLPLAARACLALESLRAENRTTDPCYCSAAIEVTAAMSKLASAVKGIGAAAGVGPNDQQGVTER